MEKRRSILKKMLASAVGLSIFGISKDAIAAPADEKVVNNVTTLQDVPLFSGSTKLGNMVFIAGKGAHVEPFEIKAHTEIVLKELEKELIKAGSSMEKVLKVGVFLNDIADYQGMNEVYKGRFGKNPPVRTTVAVAKGGVPGNSLVEMDCIAYI
ncbi:RidA family protein [Mucilaginibacter sp.]|jgi:enamine deaminase RidA (YjgF/YER057c/UK114 family)|uniref:RidA family protein n=1 Tax=Mucilaginibacter sp. TaxID=1882438 RepID=UPI0026395451|nr:RidA family protein [Mucilaginibacter sp.]MDB4920756.1 RidA family protein [Mucilaginibacter sp.]